MAIANLTDTGTDLSEGKEAVSIVDNFQSIRGGRTLDITGFAPTSIKRGHVIIRETATNQYKPMPVNGGNTAYASLPSGHTYAGVLISPILTAKPFAGIMVRGTYNPVAAPYDFATIAAAFKTAMPLIDQRAD